MIDLRITWQERALKIHLVQCSCSSSRMYLTHQKNGCLSYGDEHPIVLLGRFFYIKHLHTEKIMQGIYFVSNYTSTVCYCLD